MLATRSFFCLAIFVLAHFISDLDTRIQSSNLFHRANSNPRELGVAIFITGGQSSGSIWSIHHWLDSKCTAMLLVCSNGVLLPNYNYSMSLHRPVARGGSGGSEEPPSWKKGPQFQ